MATNQGRKIRKLYFDVAMHTGVTSAAFLCTQFTAGTPGDRYGSLLQAALAATGSTPPGIKQKLAVSAWFQPSQVNGAASTISDYFPVDFVGANLTSRLPYLTVGNAAVATKAGQEAIYSVTSGIARDFGVRVRKVRASGTADSLVSVNGVLYVQRQHSIEV